MNIFKILSNGKGSINENFSSFLAYFLDPKNKHDIQYGLLEALLDFVDPSLCEMVRLNKNTREVKCTVDLEETFSMTSGNEQKIRTVDIVIRVYNTALADGRWTRTLVHVIAIENKIQSGSSDRDQFLEEFQCIQIIF